MHDDAAPASNLAEDAWIRVERCDVEQYRLNEFLLAIGIGANREVAQSADRAHSCRNLGIVGDNFNIIGLGFFGINGHNAFERFHIVLPQRLSD